MPAVVLICITCWVLSFLLLPDLTIPESSYPLWQSAHSLLLPAWSERLASFLIYAVIGYSLIELNNQFAIIRLRASAQTCIYFLLATICPEMHFLYAGDMAAVVFLISIYFLFKSYQQPQPSIYLFYSFLFIGGGSIFFPQFTFFAILWLIEAYRFRSLNLRSFFAALLGWLLPYWFLMGHAFFYNQMELFYHPFIELASFSSFLDIGALKPWEIATLSYLLVMFIVSAIHCITSGFEDKIRTRTYLQFLINLTFFTFVLILLQPAQCINLLPLLTISISILIGHFFALTSSKASNIFFICSMGALILLFGFNTWTLL